MINKTHLLSNVYIEWYEIIMLTRLTIFFYITKSLTFKKESIIKKKLMMDSSKLNSYN